MATSNLVPACVHPHLIMSQCETSSPYKTDNAEIGLLYWPLTPSHHVSHPKPLSLHLGHVHPPPPPPLFNSLHASTLAKLLTSLQQGCFGRFLGKEGWSTSDILRRKRFVQRTQSTQMSCAPPLICKKHPRQHRRCLFKMSRMRKLRNILIKLSYFLSNLIGYWIPKYQIKTCWRPVENTRRQIIWGYWQESYWAMSALGPLLWI